MKITLNIWYLQEFDAVKQSNEITEGIDNPGLEQD